MMHEPSQAAIHAVLAPNERLLWCGRPGQVSRLGDIIGIGFFLVWTGFILAVSIAHGFHAVSLVFLLVGVGGLLWIGVVDPYQRAHRAYGVTDRRVLLVQYGFRPRVEAYELRGMSEHNVICKGRGTTRGTIGLADFAQRCGYYGDSLCMPEFTVTPDAARVADLIRDAIVTTRQQRFGW